MIIDFGDQTPLRSLQNIDFSKLTSSTRTGSAQWISSTELEITFDIEPSTTEQNKIRRALLSANDNEALLTDRLDQGINLAKDYLAVDSPSNAQVVAQVKLLTRLVLAAIRIMLRRTESTD